MLTMMRPVMDQRAPFSFMLADGRTDPIERSADAFEKAMKSLGKRLTQHFIVMPFLGRGREVRGV